uniref:Uncharacterized protein LOC8276328 isoform X2 n=1 Tax=Rhizophora mucronata TaxID=61149 RepID=A0A2P2JYN2_RHIMU
MIFLFFIKNLNFVIWKRFGLEMASACARNSLFSLLQNKRLLQSTAVVCPVSSSFTVQFLVKSCGLSLESAVSASKKIELHEKKLQKIESVVEFFKCHGFQDILLAKLIGKVPRVLKCRLQSNLKPKFEFLIENGFAGQLLQDLIFSNAPILFRSLGSHIKPSIEYLRCFIDSNEQIVVASNRSSWLLTKNLKALMQPNIEFLLKEGMPVKSISKLIVRQPRALLALPRRMTNAVKAVKNLGLQPETPSFGEAVRSLLAITESRLMKKMEVFKSMGWTEEEILLAFKQVPRCFQCSERKLQSSLDFYVNSLNLAPHTIIATPLLLLYSIDKRIRPRYNVLKFLELKKLIKIDKRIVWWLNMNEKNFVEKCIRKYVDEYPNLLKVYLEQTRQKR